MTLVAAAAAAASAFAADCKCGKECSCEGGENCTCSSDEFNYTPGEGLSYGEQPIVTAEAKVSFDSKYITYGVIDGKDPITRLTGYATFLDWWYVGGEMLFDVTKGNGKRTPYGYGNRAGKLITLDAQTGLAHEFDLGETLGKLGVDFYYTYEWLPRHHGIMNDTQYLDVEFTLNDLWFEPKLWIERDIMADEGTYVNFEIGHGFEVLEGLTLRPAVGQGFGNSLRTKGYFSDVADGFNHGGIMDTTVKCELEYAFTDWLTFGAYVAYYDYLFDSNMRDAARAYNAQWGKSCDHSYNFVCGASIKATF